MRGEGQAMSEPLCRVAVQAMGGAELLRVELERGQYVLGSSSASQLVVCALGVLPRHAWIRIGEFGVEVEAVSEGSRVRIEGSPVEGAVLLLPGQRVQIGSVFLEAGEGAGESVSIPDPAFANYELGAEVARGGMGAVHRALEKSTGRTVAMKVLSAGRAGSGQRGRFVAEARVTAGLEHPGVVPVYALGTDREGVPFYSMKLIGGVTLKAVLEAMARGDEGVIRRHPLSVLLGIFEKVCDAVAYAHSRCWIHRDLKPENIMIGEFGEVLVMDWGIAKRIGEGARVDVGLESGAQGHAWEAGDDGEAVLSTLDGEVVGTPHFMSPEQARGENGRVDERSDIYALGAILYQMLSFRYAMENGKVLEVLGRVGRGELRPLEAPAGVCGSHLPGGRIPSSLAAVVGKAMALLPQERYASVVGLRDDLARYQSGFLTGAEARGPWRRGLLFLRRNRAACVAALVVLVCGVVAGVRIFGHVRSAAFAMKDLRATAAALRVMARQEAEASRLESALEKLDGAERLEPGGVESMERRAWIYVGLGRIGDAAVELGRFAHAQGQRRDGELQQALRLLERLRSVAVKEWALGDRRLVLKIMGARGFPGERLGLSGLLRANASADEERVKAELKRQGVDKSLRVFIDGLGQIGLNKTGPVLDLGPLRGLPISVLNIEKTSVTDCSPLAGMQLTALNINSVKAADYSFLRGMPLERLSAKKCDIADYSVLQGMPLKELSLEGHGPEDLRFLEDAPLETVSLVSIPGLRDFGGLKGKRLRVVNLYGSTIADLSPLLESPIEKLNISYCVNLRKPERLLDLMRMTSLQEVTLP